MLKGTTEPGRPKPSKITLDVTGINKVFLLRGTNSPMDGMLVVCRFSLALAENLQLHGSRLLIDPDMDLGAFTTVLGFGSD